MKKITILAFLCVVACQPSSPSTSQSSSSVSLTVINAPASDDIETLDLTKLPDGFPIIGEIAVPTPPQGCKLSKATGLFWTVKPRTQIMIRDMYLPLVAKTLINLALRAIYALSNKAARRI